MQNFYYCRESNALLYYFIKSFALYNCQYIQEKINIKFVQFVAAIVEQSYCVFMVKVK